MSDVLRVTGEITIKVDMPLGTDEVETPEEAIAWVMDKLRDLNCGMQDEALADEFTVTPENWE